MDAHATAPLFEATGIVIAGDRKAAALGYPTANIPCPDGIPSGIYAGEAVWHAVSYPAALYKEEGRDVLEAHLLGFSGNLYGEALTLRARHKVRDGRKFPDEASLVAAIADDIASIRKLCSQE